MKEHSFKSSGLRVARIGGIEFWIHWTLLIWFAYILYLAWIRETSIATLGRTAVWWAAVLCTVVIHELGHCIAASRQGGGADAVVLWPLGGFAECDAPQLPRNQFWVAAGGILAQAAPLAIAGLLLFFLNLDGNAFPDPEASYLSILLGALFWWNLAILVFNIVPLYPLDGARMLLAVIWGLTKSRGRASLILVWISRITILICAVLALFADQDFNWILLGLLLWSLFETEKLRARLLSGETQEEGVFGYDFSRGYTSIERTAVRDRPKSRPTILQRLRQRMEENRAVKTADVRRQVDELLDKISREGMTSLSRQERQFLEQSSKKFKSGG